MRLPGRRLAAAAGMRMATSPPGRAWARQCCTQASSDSPRGGRPYSHRGSPVSSSYPHARSLNGGSQTTMSARTSGNPSSRSESPATTSARASRSSSRTAVSSAEVSPLSCPRTRASAKGSRRPPTPHAGSKTVKVPPVAASRRASRATCSATSDRVTESCREWASA